MTRHFSCKDRDFNEALMLDLKSIDFLARIVTSYDKNASTEMEKKSQLGRDGSGTIII